MNDKRYSIQIKFNGTNHKEEIPTDLKQGQQYVARFCGEYISGHNAEKYARWACILHQYKHKTNLNIFQL